MQFETKLKIGGALVVVLLVGFFACCKRITVDAGHAVVMVKKPYIFGHGGVVKEAIMSGSVWVARSTEGWEYPVIPKQYVEKFDDIMTRGKSLVDFDSSVRLTITDAPKLHEKFGTKWYENNVQKVLQTIIRNLCRDKSMDELMADANTIKTMEDEVQRQLTDHLAKTGLPVRVEDVVIGKVSPNQEVLDEINKTAAQQQRKNTEDQRKLAEDARKSAESSRAAADNAYRLSMGLSPEQFIQNEAIKGFVKASELCANGKDCTMVLVPPGQSTVLPAKR